jgi:hypothetical protein
MIIWYLIIFFIVTLSSAFAFDPNNPAGSGYVLSFDDEFTTLNSVDVNNSGAVGFKWYVQYPYGASTTPANRFSLTTDGLVLTPQSGDNTQWMMATAAKRSSNAQGFVGNVFGGVDGYYAEAQISFDNTLVNTSNGWPSFWAESLQHMITTDQWAGQASGYAHFIEDDFFEYDTAAGSGANSYGQAVHDWYGLYKVTCSGFCDDTLPNFVVKLNTTTWTTPHTISQLYIPGTASNGFVGLLQNFFDGVHVNVNYTWTNAGARTPPLVAPYLGSIMDRQSVAIVLGTGVGAPMTIRYVRVWVPGGFPSH